jgi:hypothetical protein
MLVEPLSRRARRPRPTFRSAYIRAIRGENDRSTTFKRVGLEIALEWGMHVRSLYLDNKLKKKAEVEFAGYNGGPEKTSFASALTLLCLQTEPNAPIL